MFHKKILHSLTKQLLQRMLTKMLRKFEKKSSFSGIAATIKLHNVRMSNNRSNQFVFIFGIYKTYIT